MKQSPNTTVLVDEAYFEYGTMPGYETMIPLAVQNPRVVVARTFSKCFGMAGHPHRLRHRPQGHDRKMARLGRRSAPSACMALQGAQAALARAGSVGEGRAEAQRRGARVHAEVVRGSRLHADRLADQLHVRGHQAAVARLPRGVHARTACWWRATSRPTRRRTCASRWARWPKCRRPCRCSRRCSRRRPRRQPPRPVGTSAGTEIHDHTGFLSLRERAEGNPVSFRGGRRHMEIDRRAFIASIGRLGGRRGHGLRDQGRGARALHGGEARRGGHERPDPRREGQVVPAPPDATVRRGAGSLFAPQRPGRQPQDAGAGADVGQRRRCSSSTRSGSRRRITCCRAPPAR